MDTRDLSLAAEAALSRRRFLGVVWDRQTLDAFLADPLGTVPVTFMTYAGIEDPEERAQLLAFLEVATRSEECRAAERRASGSGGPERPEAIP